MYHLEAYNNLSSLRTAASLVDEKVLTTLYGTVRQFFLDNAAHKDYGIALLHKHFDIGKGERIVEYGHTSTPWKVGQEERDVLPQYAGHIVPRSFRLHQGAATAYEFAYSTTGTPSSESSFVTDGLEMLKNLGLDQIFGLRLLGDHNPHLSVEVTEGKANIMLSPEGIPPTELIEALYVFNDNDNDRCHCREHCWPVKDGHDKDHSCG